MGLGIFWLPARPLISYLPPPVCSARLMCLGWNAPFLDFLCNLPTRLYLPSAFSQPLSLTLEELTQLICLFFTWHGIPLRQRGGGRRRS